MADIQLINLGLAPGDKKGQNLRSGGEKINSNFTALNNQAAVLDGRVAALEKPGDSASFGNGLQVDDITKVVSVKAKVEGGIAVSADGVQISADLAQTINNKATEEALQAVAEVVGNNATAITSLQDDVGANAQAITGLQNDTLKLSAQNNEVGSYALVVNYSSTTQGGNATVAGSSLRFAGPAIYSNGSVTPSLGIGTSVPSGTWRLMGHGSAAVSGYAYMLCLAKRIA